MPARARYTIDDIRTGALGVVDREGLEALTMRRLATALGTGPMTIYNYVSDRAGLEALVVDAVVGSIRLPPPGLDWERDVRTIATAFWTAVRRHPAAIPLVLTRRSLTPSSLAAADALVAALERGGFAGVELLAAFRTVLAFVMGLAQAELAGPLAPPGDTDVAVAAARVRERAGTEFTHIAALAGHAARSSPEREFRRGLDIVMRGLVATRAPAARRGPRQR